MGNMADPDDPDTRPDARPTKMLHYGVAGDGMGWQYAVAALERINTWSVMALRLGILALLQECTRAMAQPNAPAKLVTRARELIDALGKMPWDR